MTTNTMQHTTSQGDLREKPDGEIHPAAEVGWYLQRERETLGHNLVEVAAQLRVDPQFLHALELGELHHQLGWTYVLSYVRSYSDFLGFEPGPVVRHYRKILASEPKQVPGDEKDETWPFSEVRARAAIATFAGVVGLMGVAGFVFDADKTNAAQGLDVKPSSTSSDIFVPKNNKLSKKNADQAFTATPVGGDAVLKTHGSVVKINLLIDAKSDKVVPTIAMRDVPLPHKVSEFKRSWVALQRIRDFNTSRLAAVSEN